MIVDARNLDWVEANFEQLRANHGGEWIAVRNQTLIGHAKTLNALGAVLGDKAKDPPFIKYIPALGETYEPPAPDSIDWQIERAFKKHMWLLECFRRTGD